MSAWKLRKLIDLAEYINGYSFAPEDWGTEGLPIVRIEQLKNPGAPTDYYAGRLPEKNIIDDGDLVFSWSASLFLRIWNDGKAALNQHLFKVVEKAGVNRTFLKSFIEFYLPDLMKASHGSTMQHITRKELKNFAAQFPVEEADQKNIADVITALDHIIEQTEAIIAKQQRIKTGLMQDLLTKGIDEHGNIRSEATHAFKDSPLGRIPMEWNSRTIRNSAEVCNNLRKPLSAQVRETMQGDYPYYGPTGVLDYIDKFRVNGKYVLIGEDGDHFLKWDKQEMTILINDPCNVNNHAHILKGNDAVLTDWLHFYFLHRDITYYLTRQGAGRFKLNKATLLDLPLAAPESVVEQGRICEVIEKVRVDQSDTQSRRHKLQSIRVGLLADLLSGRRRVTNLLMQATPQ
ncbi:restriction endonuclease subunit S [Nitrosomonas sp. Nm33]|uniref:restriction endonuclease subunit S n=1 Tax=Nitrosomonas sp. Nm33 TaxID=133724 RepID=UPI000896FE9D|nr:restriction endonuclease subunit S [Nitrosomonas sp. Nm33]SDY12111.1 Restriction endonuclease S subunit [Nitrosomonas sp. Nm33]